MTVRLLALCALLALAVGGCSSIASDLPRVADGSQRTTVRLGRVIQGDISGTLSFSGELRSRGQVLITPRVSGTLARIGPSLGQRVGVGDAVAELDRTLLEEQVQRSQAALSAAEARRVALQTAARPEEIAAAQALYNAANARLADVQGASQSPAQALAAPSAARAYLDDLEGVDQTALQNAEQLLDTAAAQLNAALSGSNTSRDQVEQARISLNNAREALIAARQPADPAALSQARDAVAVAERDLILADMAASPINTLEAQAFAELAYQRLLTVSSPASEAQLAAAQAEVDHAAAVLELARQTLNGATLVVPVSGVVTQRLVAEGSPVGPGVAILEITPLDLDLEFAVPEDDVGSVPVGQEIAIAVAAYPQESFTGSVSVTAPSVDPRDRTVRALASVADPQSKLKAGMLAQVSVTIATRENALLLPIDAMVPQGDSTSTWLVVDGRARQQTVRLGVRDAQRIEVTDGLFEGAEVILNPPPSITEGQTVVAQ